jgi:septum formation topological specificity factor MinE
MSNPIICENCQKECTNGYHLTNSRSTTYNRVGQPIRKDIKRYYCSEDCSNQGDAETKRQGALKRLQVIRHAKRQLKELTEARPRLTKKGVALINKFINFENAIIQAVLKKITKEQFTEIATEVMELAYDLGDQCMCDATTRTEYVLLTYDAI